jgi:hypothetical protein
VGPILALATSCALLSTALAGKPDASAVAEGVRLAHLSVLQNYLDAIKPLPKKTRLSMGIELEGVFAGRSRDLAFEKLGDLVELEFRKHIYAGAMVEKSEYGFKTRRGEPRKGLKLKVTFADSKRTEEWHLRDDGSIRPPEDFYGVELVSPILRRASDVEKFRRLIAFLRARNFEAQPDSAALQAHVGFNDDGPISRTAITAKSKVAEVLLMILTFSKIENELMEIFAVHPDRQKFTMPTPTSVVSAILNGKIPIEKTRLSEFVETNYQYRYWALNVYSLFQFGTVEVRFANSTVDQETIDAFLEFSQKIVRAVRTKDPRLVKLLQEHVDENIPVDELAAAFNLKIRHLSLRHQCNSLLKAEVN